eukprot:scaffold328189_cov76-Cyclotella_meneghiniana.AAC.1
MFHLGKTLKLPLSSYSDGNNEATIDDLVDGGIPRLPARDICRAMSEVIQRRSRPMIVLWDIESISIPTQTSAALVVSQIKDAIAPYGQLKQFRVYTSVSLGHTPEQKRSELHLLGCNLVEGRKEVADKMIIVDAMEFAYTHIDGATLCFITGDVDYAYLLSKLDKPQWTTILISKGDGEPMLRTNCNVNLRWETDVLHQEVGSILLQERDNHRVTSAPPGSQRFREGSSDFAARKLPSTLTTHPPSFSASDIQLLQKIVSEGVSNNSPGLLKSHAASMLKQSDPNRFADRVVRKAFLSRAIDMGVVFESGVGNHKTLYLNEADIKENILDVNVRETAPLSINEMPTRAAQAAKTFRFIIFVEKMHVPKRGSLSGAFIEGTELYLLLMFRSLKEARSFAKGRPWLYRHGVLVNWSKCSHDQSQHCTVNQNENGRCTTSDFTTACSLCKLMTAKESIFFFKTSGDGPCEYCRSCFESSGGWSENEQKKSQEKVVSLLKMLEEYDDIILPRSVVRNKLIERYPLFCASKDEASLWIDNTIQAGFIIETKRKREKVLALTEYKKFADAPYPQMDTSEVESYIIDLLRTNGTTMDRKTVNNALREKDPQGMSNPFMRSFVIRNAASKNLIFIVKNAYMQVVGLNYEDAIAVVNAGNSEFAPPKTHQVKIKEEDVEGGVFSEVTQNHRREDLVSQQLPDLGSQNLKGPVLLENGSHEHNNKNDDNNDGNNVHQLSRKRRQWDDKGQANDDASVQETGKRSKSNLPAWMTMNNRRIF